MREDTVTVYVALRGEDIDVWRPVKARRVSDLMYRIIEQPYDPESETWEFAPGSTVRCEERILSDGPALVAVGDTAGDET